MKRIGFALSVGISLFLNFGCATLDKRFENVRKSETILFEGKAQTGIILSGGNRISWDSSTPVPIIATPTNFHYGASTKAYSHIDHVEVIDFNAAKELFIKATLYEGLLIVSEGAYRKRVFLMVPESGKSNPVLHVSERRELAVRLAEVIQARRGAVDVFGQIPTRRSLWIGTNTGLAFHMWWRTPQYLDLRFPAERQSIDSLFKSARARITETFSNGIRQLILQSRPPGSQYSLVDAGEVKMGWSHHKPIVKKLGERDQELESIIIIDTIRLFLEEKIDPSGKPSVQIRFAATFRFYDLIESRLAEYRSLDYTTTLSIQTLLETGEEAIIAETGNAMVEFSRKLEEILNEKLAAHPYSIHRKRITNSA